MTPEALDFKAECEQIHALLKPQDETIFDRVTQFKDWTIGDIIAHLHLWNIGADLSLNDPSAFAAFIGGAMTQLSAGKSHAEFQTTFFKGQSSAEIFEAWSEYYPQMTERFHAADPEHRVKWAGPDMINTNRIKNIAHIGVTTFSWSFKVRGKTPPAPKPYVKLTAPSGEIWTWNDPQSSNQITGLAEEFAQVVTQCRNIKDTHLITTGDIAVERAIRLCPRGYLDIKKAAHTSRFLNSLSYISLRNSYAHSHHKSEVGLDRR